MLTDAQWAVLEPLVLVARPCGKTPHEDLRRAMEAIIWRHRNGATWRALPAALGTWWGAAQTFIRWGKQGVWEHLLALAQERAGGVELGMAFLYGTDVRAHAKAAGAPKMGPGPERDVREALGRSRGGFGTKVTAVADSRGRAVAFHLAPGQARELPGAPALLSRLPGTPAWVVADRRSSSDAFRAHVWDMGARPAVPAKRNEAAVRCPDFIYRHHNRIERMWGRLKEWRAVATRYEKTAPSFMAVLCLAATMDWIKS